MTPYKILFVCTHNSARSQMAEVFLNTMAGDVFVAESAGIEPGKLNPNVVKVMSEIGIDISQKHTQSVFDLFREGKKYDAVITVCEAGSAGRCPIFPGKVKREAWSFPDPSGFTGMPEEVLAKTRQVRDAIQEQVKHFISEAKEYTYWTK